MKHPFPKRILSFESSVKVIDVGNRDVLGIYATLSHRWARRLPCMITTDNRRDRLEGIPWTELPQTFKDAIRYCLELEVSYLWIDALCIIQDDPDDWQDQSAKMADIYQNSYINLTATSSDCGSSGCFPNTPQAYKERYLETPRAGGKLHQILIRQRLSHWAVPPTVSSNRENPLLSRGWVFQERVLSPRNLHFCKDELVWECGQETVCECGSMPKTRNLKRKFALAARLPAEEVSTQSRSRVRIIQLSDPESEEDEELRTGISPSELLEYGRARAIWRMIDNAIRQWHGIVEQYSALELTHDKDRLPALSGLAERMAPFLGNYLAGLWRRSIVPDLCWRVDKLVPGHQRPAEYRGPSWSWVSTKAKVAFWATPPVPDPWDIEHIHGISNPRAHDSGSQGLRNNRAHGINIISCTVNNKGKNKYGQVSSALLLVEGNLKTSKIWKDTMEIPDSLVPPSFEVEVERGSETSPASEVAFGPGMEFGIKMHPGVASWRFPFFPDYIFSSDGPYKISTSDVVFLLGVAPNICLVLLRTSLRMFRETFIFRRIGILSIPHQLQERYRIDIMRGSQRTRVAII